jgi:cytoskeleton protein RodZ
VTVGERLREARERQKVSLHAIAEKTNISVRFLDAIEKNQFDKLPGGIFTRGFIRSYAAQVGLDPDGTVAQFLSDEPAQRDDDIDEAPPSDREGMGIGTLLLAGLGVIALALALVYLFKPDWMGLHASDAPPQADSAPASAEVSAAEAPKSDAAVGSPVGVTTPAIGTSAQNAPSPTQSPAPSVAASAPAPEAPKSPLHLVVTPTGRCWVQVSADGQMRVAREIAAGERIAIDAAERLQITVGDAGNFSYELNGRPGKALGVAGRVARATILPSTASQFQVQ